MSPFYGRPTLIMALAIAFVAVPARAQSELAAIMRPVVKRVMPAYPVLARQINVRGSVRLEAAVAADGTVKTFTVKGGHPILVDAAEVAIRKWKYAPAAHESTELIEIHFDPQ